MPTTPTPRSHASGTADLPLLGDIIGENPARALRTFPERDALVDRAAARRWTYTEPATDVDARAPGLLELAIAQGNRVGIRAPDCAERTLTQCATAKLGVILVTVNQAYRPMSWRTVHGPLRRGPCRRG
ncbi:MULTISPECIES: AMP-binding protein [unclassified Kitasatospora]